MNKSKSKHADRETKAAGPASEGLQSLRNAAEAPAPSHLDKKTRPAAQRPVGLPLVQPRRGLFRA